MKTHPVPVAVILSVLLLSACSANATPTEEAALDTIYTAAASTLFAQEMITIPTPTATEFVSATLLTLPTTIPVTVAAQNAVVSYSSASTANGCNNAAYVNDVTISDGTVLAPGETFTKTWTFQNTGTCAWAEDYLITFVSGTDMDGETTNIDQDVEAGDTGEISISLVAPSSEGSYTGYWRLADGDGNLFGQSVYVLIVVSEDAFTLTPTTTPTSEATSTTELTSTFTPTAVPTTYP
jgi:hypothetical protein